MVEWGLWFSMREIFYVNFCWDEYGLGVGVRGREFFEKGWECRKGRLFLEIRGKERDEWELLIIRIGSNLEIN